MSCEACVPKKEEVYTPPPLNAGSATTAAAHDTQIWDTVSHDEVKAKALNDEWSSKDDSVAPACPLVLLPVGERQPFPFVPFFACPAAPKLRLF